MTCMMMSIFFGTASILHEGKNIIMKYSTALHACTRVPMQICTKDGDQNSRYRQLSAGSLHIRSVESVYITTIRNMNDIL